MSLNQFRIAMVMDIHEDLQCLCISATAQVLLSALEFGKAD
jgi:hypothetical protein